MKARDMIRSWRGFVMAWRWDYFADGSVRVIYGRRKPG